MGLPHDLVPFDYQKEFAKAKSKHARRLNKSICLPSTIQAYNMANQFVKYWFLSRFEKDTFKSVYVDGKNIMDEFRRVPKPELIKRPKPSLAIFPSIDLGFNNDGVEFSSYGLDVYAPLGRYKDSFFKDDDRDVYLGLSMQTLLINFNIRCRFETKSQQMDAYKYIQMAHRVGSIYGEDIDIDFHIPYGLMIQIAEDAGFEIVYSKERQKYPEILNIHSFLSYLNTHSGLPFIYKYRADNGKNEFFIRMRDMYVNINPTDLSADDGETEGHMKNNFGIDMTLEIRFPAPQYYAYYSSNEHKIKTVYGSWNNVNGVITAIYCFKGLEVPPTNKAGWTMWVHTTYEDKESIGQKLTIDFTDLFKGEMADFVQEMIHQNISPAIFCDMILINNAQVITGKMDWETLTFTSNYPVESAGTFIGVYLDMEYLNNYRICKTGANKERITPTEKEYTDYSNKATKSFNGNKK